MSIHPKILLWELTVGFTEYGHWFAALSFIVLVLRFRSGKWSDASLWLALLGFVFFLQPLWSAVVSQKIWKAELRKSFGQTSYSEKRVLDFGRLWMPAKLYPGEFPREQFTYFESPGLKLTLDFYRAQGRSAAPFVLVVHGGGWDAGNTTDLAEIHYHLAREGISVAALNYRLAPQYKWPAPKEDVLEAVKFLKAHAAQLNIDPNRWAIYGRSAGAQIAEAVSLSSRDASLKGCIGLYGPSDLLIGYYWGAEDDILKSRELMRKFLGGPPDKNYEAYEDASPIFQVSRGAPPLLILHGAEDTIVWLGHAQRLKSRLNAAGVQNALVELPWGTHGFDYNINGPGGQVTTYAVDYFLSAVFSQKSI